LVELGGGTRGVTMLVPLRMQVGARTVATIHRRLTRVSWSLDDVLAGTALTLPPLAGDGYLLTSVPATLRAEVTPAGLLAVVRQRYTRFHADLAIGHDAWSGALAGDRRAAIKRKTAKIAAMSGGRLDVRTYRTAADLAVFSPIAQRLSALTYQSRLLDSGFPTDAVDLRQLRELAARDRLRAWLLYVDDRPAAYLCCTASGATLCYDHVGHDPALAALSPGTVLQAAALRDLFADRFARFDFSEGEGQHKRLFATHGTACVDLLLLRPTWRNRAVAALLAGFDRTIAASRSRLPHTLARRLRR
jgi:hypothetical protein